MVLKDLLLLSSLSNQEVDIVKNEKSKVKHSDVEDLLISKNQSKPKPNLSQVRTNVFHALSNCFMAGNLQHVVCKWWLKLEASD